MALSHSPHKICRRLFEKPKTIINKLNKFSYLILRSASRVITTVTGEVVTRRLESGYVIEILKGQPGSEIVLFTTKVQPFQEDNLVSTQAVREYLALVWEQYKLANRKMRSTLLDEVCRNLKMHRKAAIRALRSTKPPRSVQGKGAKTKRRRYSEASKAALEQVWRAIIWHRFVLDRH